MKKMFSSLSFIKFEIPGVLLETTVKKGRINVGEFKFLVGMERPVPDLNRGTLYQTTDERICKEI